MAEEAKSGRELAARALSRVYGHPEDGIFDGKPLWMFHLDAADAVLEAIGWEEREVADEPVMA